MRTWRALIGRELGVYFVSPMAYLILTAFLFLSGYVFCASVAGCVAERLPARYIDTLSAIGWIAVMASPLVTMRLIAEEKNRGTLEIMLTAPVSEAQFVLAKFFSSVLFLLYLLFPTVGYVLVISHYGQVDAGAVASGYLGVILIGALAYSIGLFISSLCSSQATAGIITFVVVFLLFAAGMLGSRFSRNPLWLETLQWVDLSANVMDFFKGVIDLRRLVYLFSVPAFFLFLTVRVVESRRWR